MLKGIDRNGVGVDQGAVVLVVRPVPSTVCMPKPDALDLTRAARAWQRDGEGVEARRVLDENVLVKLVVSEILPEVVDETPGKTRRGQRHSSVGTGDGEGSLSRKFGADVAGKVLCLLEVR